MITPDKIPLIVRSTAQELAGAFYEENKRSPEFRKGYPKPELYVLLQWPRYINEAMAALLTYATQPGVSDLVKEEIYDARLALNEAQYGVEQSETAH